MMKKTILVLVICLLNQTIKAQNEFISTWRATENYKTIEIPTYNGLAYNYNVNWGDGSVSNNVVGDISHEYGAIGNYTVTITGIFPGINFKKIYKKDDPYNDIGIISIDQWGNNQWKTMEGAFYGQKSLVINTNQTPDLSQCTNMDEVFYYNKNLHLSSSNSWNAWNTSTITTMKAAFAKTNFNEPIENWDVSNVTNMNSLFLENESFNQPLNNWDVGNVTDMSSMFMRAINFNQPLNNWDVSKVIYMTRMFFIAKVFNQPLNNWDVSKVTKMNLMFDTAQNFNQPLINWDVSNVTDMGSMFKNASAFSQAINGWNVSNVTSMKNMFLGANSFNQPLNNWNVSKVENMGSMFSMNTIFNQPLNNWDVSNVTNMSRMFSENTVFNQDISNWDISKVEYLSNMFAESNFNQPLNNWNLSNVLQMSEMFQNNTVFNQPLNNWNISKVTDMHRIFSGASAFNQEINNWDTSSVIFMNGVFQNALAFDKDISSWNVEKVTTCVEMFENIKLNATNYDALLIAWNAQNLKQNVVFDVGNSKYRSNEAAIARQNMIDNDNWTIRDKGIELFTWTGNFDTDWNNPLNWDTNSVPTQNNNVVIADVVNAPTIKFNQNHSVNNLINHEVISIKTTSSLTIFGNLDQRNSIIIDSFVNTNGSLVLKGDQTNENPSNIIYNRYVSANNKHLISLPVTDLDIDAFATNTPLTVYQGNDRGLQFYNNNNIPAWEFYQNGANNSGNFITGKGYSINTSANSFLKFEGKLNSKEILNYPIQDNNEGWNLIGNPFPAFINANFNADANSNFLTENVANLHPAFASIYVFNPNTNSYEPIGNGLGAKYIAPGQGFFVKSKEDGGVVNIHKSMLSHQNGDLFLKEEQPEKIVLQINDGTTVSETTIAFKQGMTNGLDTTFDVAVFTGDTNRLSLFTTLLEGGNEIPFAIQFLPELDNNNFTVPLGFSQTGNQEITLSLKSSNIPSNIKLFIKDKVLNTVTEISNAADYKFFKQGQNSENRFLLSFEYKSLSLNSIKLKNVDIYSDANSTLYVNGALNSLLSIYSITGQNLVNDLIIDNQKYKVLLPKISKGIYIIHLKQAGRYYTKKIIF
ncbi:MAG: BspA family leucine-rich repeat surface protein [Flavobacteriaceae bacterium]